MDWEVSDVSLPGADVEMHYVTMCVSDNVVRDTKMSLGTSSETAAIVFVFFWIYALFSWTVFVTA